MLLQRVFSQFSCRVRAASIALLLTFSPLALFAPSAAAQSPAPNPGTQTKPEQKPDPTKPLKVGPPELQPTDDAKPTPDAKAPINTPSPASDSRTRVELNLLGKEDASAGESRRNENIQFNLVDNNALKELNLRLGATATIVEFFRADRGYYGSEFGNAPSPLLSLTPVPLRRAWHGNLFWLHQNSVFSARSFFQVGDVQPAHDNRYGFNTGFKPWRGGYFSVAGSQDRLRGNVNGTVLVPSESERTVLATDPRARALVQRFLNAYPTELPNRTDINPRALNRNAPQAINGDEATLRFDQDLSPRDRLMNSYQFVEQNVDAFQLVNGQNPNTDTKSHRARMTWARQWSPAVNSTFTVGYDRIRSLLLPDSTAVGPMVSIAGLTTLGPAGDIPINRAQNLFRYGGDVRGVRGHHTWTAGFNLLRRQFNGEETDAHRGYYSFSNDFGRTGIQNLLMGTPSQYIISTGNVWRGYRQWLDNFYIGDTWKVRPRLTLQLGLRYEIVARPKEVNNLEQVPYGCDCNNVAPSLGVAYSMPGHWGVLRAAGGVAYGEILPVSYSQIRFSPPGSQKLVVTAPDLVNPLSGISTDAGSGKAKGNLYLLDPQLASPYSYQYNFTWEPAFWRSWRLQMGYVGSRSHKLLVMWYLNRAHATAGIPQTTATINDRRANQNLADVRWVLNGSQGYFDAARVTLVAPSFHGFTIDAAYWYSKAMDLGADYTNTGYDNDSRLSRSQSEFETHKDRKALSLFDQPNSFLVTAHYQFAERAWGNWVDHITRALGFSAVVLLKNGTPFTVTTPDGPGFGNVDGNGNDRPNLLNPSVLGRTIGNPDTSVQLLPASAFAFMAPTDEKGNLGANTFRRGAIRNVNAAITKSWRVGPVEKLTLRAESINLLNTPQFAEPNAVLGTPGFGTITNTLNDGRAFRFGLSANW